MVYIDDVALMYPLEIMRRQVVLDIFQLISQWNFFSFGDQKNIYMVTMDIHDLLEINFHNFYL